MKEVCIESVQSEFLELWNDEFGDNFPLHDILFKQNGIDSLHILENATFGLVDDNKFVGLIISKIYKDKDVEIAGYKNKGFISLFYVKPEYRRKKIGSKIINKALEVFNICGKSEIIIGQDINNFFPGLPLINQMISTQLFLENLGFKKVGRCFDLLMSNNPKFEFDGQFTYKVVSNKDKFELLNFIKNEFSGRWYYEALSYFNHGGCGREFVVVLDKNTIIGFARINDQESKQQMYNINWSKRYVNLGGIGPLGINKNQRGKGLGANIVKFGTQVLFNRGCSDVIVDWTGINKFYEKIGFKVSDEFLGYQKII